ncbi:MAG: flagellin [Candidatus Pelagisphaera sp.]|jgi:flagellin
MPRHDWRNNIKDDNNMPVTINTNSAATVAKNNLNSSNAMLQKSLNRLSSGMKIVNPSDDAGGLAVSMKLSAAIKRTEAVNTNLANAQSFLQTQDGALSTAGKVLDRMSELKTMSTDVTKNSTDIANYDTEFTALKAQLNSLSSEKFNGVSLFTSAASATTLAVGTTEDGSTSVNIDQATLANAVANATGAANLSALSQANAKIAIEDVATLRASNGAQASQMNFASDMLTINKQNLEAANSRIMDVDVASESTQLARANILVQAGSSMLGQANSSSQVALKLIS